MPRLLLAVLALDALCFAAVLIGALASRRQPDGIGEGLMYVYLLVTGIQLACGLLFWFLRVPYVALAVGLLPALAVVVWQGLAWQGRHEYAETLAGADDFTEAQAQTIARAIARGDEPKLRALRAQGANFNAAGKDGETLLTFATFYWPERVPLLLELGADPNAGAGPESGPLYRAAVTGKGEVVAALLAAGARPDLTDNEGTPVIFHTLKTNETISFAALVAHGATLTGRDARGYTLLMAAAYARRWRDALLLLEHGADPTVTTRQGESLTSLLTAAFMDEASLADPDYRAFIERLGARGVVIHR